MILFSPSNLIAVLKKSVLGYSGIRRSRESVLINIVTADMWRQPARTPANIAHAKTRQVIRSLLKTETHKLATGLLRMLITPLSVSTSTALRRITNLLHRRSEISALNPADFATVFLLFLHDFLHFHCFGFNTYLNLWDESISVSQYRIYKSRCQYIVPIIIYLTWFFFTFELINYWRLKPFWKWNHPVEQRTLCSLGTYNTPFNFWLLDVQKKSNGNVTLNGSFCVLWCAIYFLLETCGSVVVVSHTPIHINKSPCTCPPLV